MSSSTIIYNLFYDADIPRNWVVDNHFHAIAAAQNGWLNDLQRIISNNLFKPLSSRITAAVNNNLLVVAAAAGGQLDVIKWIVQKSGQPLDLTAQHNRSLRFAVESGSLDLVRWLVLESGQPIDVTADSHLPAKIASEAGATEIEDFLNTVAELQLAGVSITRIQAAPAIVDIVQSGQLSADFVSSFSDEDLSCLNNLANKSVTRTSIRHR